MKITTIAIKRGITFFMIYIIVIGFGLFSLARLKIDLFPDLTFPVIAVITQYTGVNPYDIETTVTRPLEETVSSVENVTKVSSSSSQGISLVILEFDWGTDMDQAEINTRKNIDLIRDYLPEDATDPLVFAFDPSLQPIMFLSVNSDQYGLAELRRIAENDIEPRLERIPGVANASTYGGLEREIKVLVDPNRLQAHGFSIDQVVNALRMNSMQIPAGWITDKKLEFSIQTAGEFQNIDQIRNTALASINGTQIRVRDVAEVVDGFKEQRQRQYMNETQSVMIFLNKQSDANTVQVCNGVNKQLSNITDVLPSGVDIDVFWDQSTFIKKSVSNLSSTAIEAMILAFLVLLFFLLNVRSSIIVAISIPTSLVVTFVILDQAGLTLNLISMAGLALAVGLLVDNSIVVLENIFRRRQLGDDMRTAAERGGSEVSMAITASTLTTLSVFLPVLFVPGIAGELFNDMVITICFSLLASLAVALTLVPLLSSRFLEIDSGSRKNNVFTRIGKGIQKMLDALNRHYNTFLRWSIRHKGSVLIAVFIMFLVSVAILFTRGGDFFPDSDQEFIAMTIKRAPGTNLDEMESTVKRIAAMIKEEVPEMKDMMYNFGQGEGVGALFGGSGSHMGEINIRLKGINERNRSQMEIEDVLLERFDEFAGTEITFQEGGMGAMFGEGDIVVQIFGHDLSQSQQIAEEIREGIEKIPGTSQVRLGVDEAIPELKIELDRDRISDLGLSSFMVAQTISSNILGTVATTYREGGDEYDIRVQLKEEYRTNSRDLEDILIFAPNGARVPLRAIAKVQSSTAPQEINREDQERLVTVSMMVTGRDLRSVTTDVQNYLKRIVLPNEYRLEISGVAEEQQESFMYLGIAMLVAILLTYMVMAAQFESLLDPFIIIFTIPLSFIGVALSLLLTGTTLTVMAIVGIIMLVGIVVNNGIVLVDYMNQLREEGVELVDAAIEGGRTRLRPVLMTALTTILAMIPLALGLGESGENWAPMARSVIGGLTAATFLTLIIIPILYILFERISLRVKEKRQARRYAKIELESASN
ncbi:efflux RND transporter permease subunit [candidate division KSB1 bacterium]|nr:efflux RND transporter permease subunit [candidate division KSB1 bacterium]